jgi:methionyl-tRNA synthetase
VGELFNACQFRAALNAALALAREANGCLDRKALWFQIKEDPQAAATTVYVTQSVRAVDNLKTILAPTLCVPHTPVLRGAVVRHPAGGRVRGRDAQPPGPDLRPQRCVGDVDEE